MHVQDFDFNLPEHLIAQTPLVRRSDSKLLVVHSLSKQLEHTTFNHLIDYLEAGDVLVLNDTRVLPARLFGIKQQTGAHVELLLLNQQENIWECLVGNAKVVKVGTRVSFGDDELIAVCVAVKDEGIRLFTFEHDGIFYEVLEKLGMMPLPPYIKERLQDQERYQTVYSKIEGSAAAPTAGLHFTKELLASIEAKGVQICYVTLHVGLGTFRPIKVDTISTHQMHSEYYQMSNETALILNQAKKAGQRIISVGTTSTRVLETILQKQPDFSACHGYTDIFIYPGYTFKAVDALITNFHLPKSTLIMLVSALCGKDLILSAYQEAIEQQYRFFSFGDSMFICK